MGRPYNFFQFSSGVIGSGLVSAYPNNFTGFLTPIGMFDTPRGFLVSLAEEQYAWKDYQVNFSGDISSNQNVTASIQLSFSGVFFPVITGIPTTIDSRFSGAVSGTPIDAPTYALGFSGAVSSGIIDAPTYDLSFSGVIDQFCFEKPTLDISFTGSFLSGLGESVNYSLLLSGNIVKYNRDQVSLSAGLDYFVWDKGNVLEEEEHTESGNITCVIDFIGWSLGGV